MIETEVSEFLRKSAEYKAENPETTLVWQVTVGPSRRRRQTIPPGAQVWPERDEELFDDILKVLDGLMEEPESHAWIEARQHNRSKIEFYVHVNVGHEDIDVKKSAIRNEPAGIIATQLVKTNEQLIGLLTVKERMVGHLSQKMLDTGLTLRQLETERYMEAQFGNDETLSKAMEMFAPMLATAMAKWAQSSTSSKSPAESVAPQEYPIDENNSTDEQVDVDDLMNRIEWVCANRPDLLTEDRVSRIFTAFTSAESV